jgi:hypothetical protein
MSINLVQKAHASNTTTIPGGDLGPGTRWILEISCTFSGPVTAGNVIVVALAGEHGGTNASDLYITAGPRESFTGTASGGSGGARMVYAVWTLVDAAGRETGAGNEVSVSLSSGNRLVMDQPNVNTNSLPSGATWNAYAGLAAGAEVLQASGLAASASWTEPAPGMATTGTGLPAVRARDSLGTNYETALWHDYGYSAGAGPFAAISFAWGVVPSSGSDTVTFVCAGFDNNPTFDVIGELCISIAEYSGFVSPVTQASNVGGTSNAACTLSATDSQGVSVATTFPSFLYSRSAAVFDLACSGIAHGDLWYAVSCDSTLATPTVTPSGYMTYALLDTINSPGGRTFNVYTRGLPVSVSFHEQQRGNIDWDQTGPDARQGPYYGLKFQYADGTFTAGNLPKFLPDGTLTDSGIVAAAPALPVFATETPSGTMNGTNTAFVLSAAPTAGSLHLYLNGVEQVPSTDYSISGTAITYVVAPRSSDYMIAEYVH